MRFQKRPKALISKAKSLSRLVLAILNSAMRRLQTDSSVCQPRRGLARRCLEAADAKAAEKRVRKEQRASTAAGRA
jgi:hypothetical protein